MKKHISENTRLLIVGTGLTFLALASFALPADSIFSIKFGWLLFVGTILSVLYGVMTDNIKWQIVVPTIIAGAALFQSYAAAVQIISIIELIWAAIMLISYEPWKYVLFKASIKE